MRIITKSIYHPFSDAAIEEDIKLMRNEHHKEPWGLTLNISVFDVNHAVSIMIDKKYFEAVKYVHISPEFREGEYSLVDELNQVIVKSGYE